MSRIPSKIDTRPTGAIELHAIYIAELARAQHYAVAGLNAGVFESVMLKNRQTQYHSFPLYFIELKEKS